MENAEISRFFELEKILRDQGLAADADAIRELTRRLSEAEQSIQSSKQDFAQKSERVAQLEKLLGMLGGIRYQEMRLELPEGGHVSLRWPESMEADSAEMLREVVDLQMRAHAKYAEKRNANAALLRESEGK
jgi:hypothetical protein